MYGEISKDALHKHISTFTEGKIYRIQRFTVSAAKPKFRPVNSEFMINITVYTIAQVYKTDLTNIPMYTYKITKFSDIESLAGETRSFTGNCNILNIRIYHLSIYSFVSFLLIIYNYIFNLTTFSFCTLDVMGLTTEISEIEDYYVQSQKTMTIRRSVTLRDTRYTFILSTFI